MAAAGHRHQHTGPGGDCPPSRRSSPGPAGSAECVSCRQPFRFNPDFFQARGFRPPTRCRTCRERRAASRLPRSGHVLSGGPLFAILGDESGGEYIVRPGHLALRVGRAVTFTTTPEQPGQGFRRLAFDVAVEGVRLDFEKPRGRERAGAR